MTPSFRELIYSQGEYIRIYLYIYILYDDDDDDDDDDDNTTLLLLLF